MKTYKMSGKADKWWSGAYAINFGGMVMFNEGGCPVNFTIDIRAGRTKFAYIYLFGKRWFWSQGQTSSVAKT